MDASSPSSSSLLGLFRFADWKDKLLVILGTIGSIVDGLMQPLTMLVLARTINEYGADGTSLSIGSPDKFAVQLLYVALGVGTAAFLEGLCWTRTAERQASRMRLRYLEAVLQQDVSFFDSNSSTTATYQVISTISTDTDTIQDALAEKIPNILANISAFFFTLLVAFTNSWRLTLAALPLSLLFIVPGVVYGKLLMKVSEDIREAYGIAGGIADQAVSSIRTVVAYVGERQTMESFSQALEKTTALGIKQGLMKGILVGTMGMIYAIWAFQTWYGSVLVTEKGAQGGSIIVAGICVILGGLSLMSALPNVRYLSEAITATSCIHKMTDRLPSLKSNNQEGETIESPQGEIEFRNIEFSYPSRPHNPVLRGLNLYIAAEQTIGLVGSSGSGKSTVISLLQRFYNPDKGTIAFDGCDIRTLSIEWFRSQMGLVSQEPVLFATSIKENILFGNENASTDLIISAAKAANAHNFITKLPDGYDTYVGHFGFQMSGGQKQRIAIARALIRNPKILLLDEATSALDAQSEKLVKDALDHASVGRTTVIVAHRLATLRRADLIAVLNKGEVVELGSHDQLTYMSGEGGVYSKMAQLQEYTISRESPLMSPIGNNVVNSIHSRNYSNAELSPVHIYSENNTTKANRKTSNPSQWRLMKMNERDWRRGLIGCIGAATIGVVQNAYSYSLGSIVSVYFLQDNDLIKSNTKRYSVIFISLAFINVISNIINHYNFAVMGERLTRRVRKKMLKKVLSFEIGWFDEDANSNGAICSKLATDANKVRSLVGDRLSLLLQASVTAALAFTLSLIIAWRLAVVMIAAQPLIIGSFYFRKVMMASMSKKAKKMQIEGSQLACEAVVNQRTITAFSSQKRMLGLFEIALQGPRSENIKQSWIAGLCLFSCQFIITAGTALAFWYGGKLMSEGYITSKEMFRTFFVLMSTGKLIADAGSMTSDLAKGGDAVRSVLEILDRNTEVEPDDPKGIKKKRQIKGNIELMNVSFCYPSRPEQIIFKGLSLKMDAGKTIALVGESGSGKSTIISLIERFYDPQEGSVEIDGKNIKDYNLRFLRSHIALVSQEPTLFAGTIRDNIAYGSENATSTEVLEAAALANAHEFICSMEDGYETYCGERGVQLSGGQKQRIALARAILKNPVILLLDEATSALDSVSENLVQEALNKMMVNRTCVVVAHHLSTIEKADMIALISNGRIVEQGSHSELVAKGRGGSYYNLIRLQGGYSPYSQ
ncbi:uncharacterized protein A4U43_C02F9360 [Asparagus officinalis]|uniref:Multidrug resistance protein n=2 Tax=Asparagus officinalis TaxID=4686 RepID=A0A5P1FL53_ASPOF|nr:uncharacterized protein A4U43_C02F9360 [Asparagus officinalis]